VNFIAELAGAPQAAQTTGNFYTNAANQEFNLYGPSATRYYTAEQNAALRPAFQQQEQQLAGTEAAQGITHSGAGVNAFGNLGAQQAATLSSADSNLFAQGLQGATGIYQQMPGAQATSYSDAVDQLYQALAMAGQAAGGMPPRPMGPSSGSTAGGADTGSQGNPYGEGYG
jgi:hypothetical protein